MQTIIKTKLRMGKPKRRLRMLMSKRKMPLSKIKMKIHYKFSRTLWIRCCSRHFIRHKMGSGISTMSKRDNGANKMINQWKKWKQ